MSGKIPPNAPLQMFLDALSPEDRGTVEQFIHDTWSEDPALATTGLMAVMLAMQMDYLNEVKQRLDQHEDFLRKAHQDFATRMEAADNDARNTKLELQSIAGLRLHPPAAPKVVSNRLSTALAVLSIVAVFLSGLYFYTVGETSDVSREACILTRAFGQQLYLDARHAGKRETANFLLDKRTPTGCENS